MIANLIADRELSFTLEFIETEDERCHLKSYKLEGDNDNNNLDIIIKNGRENDYYKLMGNYDVHISETVLDSNGETLPDYAKPSITFGLGCDEFITEKFMEDKVELADTLTYISDSLIITQSNDTDKSFELSAKIKQEDDRNPIAFIVPKNLTGSKFLIKSIEKPIVKLDNEKHGLLRII